jgi:hypothetical protein
VTFRCAVQSLDFQLTGSPIVPSLQQGAEQFAPTYRVRPYERGLYQLNNCLPNLQGENKEVISISDLKGVSINTNPTNRVRPYEQLAVETALREQRGHIYIRTERGIHQYQSYK